MKASSTYELFLYKQTNPCNGFPAHVTNTPINLTINYSQRIVIPEKWQRDEYPLVQRKSLN